MSTVYNLECLKDFDTTKLPDIERMGEKYIADIQQIMKEMYGEEMMGAMPEDRLKPCILGVSRALLLVLFRGTSNPF